MAAGDRARLKRDFPGLSGSFVVTSPYDERYNCVAWVMGDNSRRWWPPSTDLRPWESHECYWPSDAGGDESVDGFLSFLAMHQYTPSSVVELEPNKEKIAIFADDRGVTHLARQLTDGQWSSKLCDDCDISHDLYDLEGEEFGRVVVIVARNVRMVPV